MARTLATTVLVVFLAAGWHPAAEAAAHEKGCRAQTATELMDALKAEAGCKKMQEALDAKVEGCSCDPKGNGAGKVNCPAKDSATTQWDSDGKQCVAVQSDKDKDWNKQTWHYPADYGESCKIHPEPGSYDCTKVVGKEAEHKFVNGDAAYNNKMDSASWCTSTWCYVDPCACDKTDIAKSSWFKPRTLYYSYQQCGSTDKFTGAQCTGGTSQASCDALSSCIWVGPDVKKDAAKDGEDASGARSQATIVSSLAAFVLVLSTLVH